MGSNEKEISNRLLKVMSTLYCQSISADFRKPVEILYPNIALDYLSIIKHPMDLGTLLLECMKGTATVKGIRDGLKQVFMNSIRFNVGAPMMEATSRHLESFATGLFEETMKIPFNEKVSLTEDFSNVLVRKRNLRLLAVCRLPLRDKEIRSIEGSLQHVQDSVPRELLAAVENIKSAIQDFFLLFESEIDDSSKAPVLTIESIFTQLLEASRLPATAPPTNTDNRSNRVILPALAGLLTSSYSDGQIGVPQLGPSVVARVDTAKNFTATETDGDNSLSSPQTHVASERLRVKANSKVALLPSTLPYLNALDSSLGILLVKLEERLLRGTGHSSVWQRPYGLVWAQPAKVRVCVSVCVRESLCASESVCLCVRERERVRLCVCGGRRNREIALSCK
jgi:Bromodomain